MPSRARTVCCSFAIRSGVIRCAGDSQTQPAATLAALDKGDYDDRLSLAARQSLEPQIERARGLTALGAALGTGGAVPASLPQDPKVAGPLIKGKESGGNYNAGYAPPGQAPVDLSHAPLGSDGFPQWAGNQGPAGISHAAGAYQFEPATWRRYAATLGITDFSPASQDRVFAAAFAKEGYTPWAATFGPKTLASVYQHIDQMGLDPATNLRVKEEARANYGALEADQMRQQRLADEQGKAQMRGREDQIIADAFSDKPQITAQQVANDPAFAADPERRLQMINVVRAAGHAGPLPGPSHAAAMGLLTRVRLPDGDPNKITGSGPLYDALIAGDISKGDFDFVRNEQAQMQTPGGEIFAKRKADFVRDIEPQIDRSPFIGMPDLKGRERLYEFNYALDQKIDEYRAAGKNPGDLLDPSKPDYAGKPDALKPYRRSLADALADLPGASNAPDLTTREGIVAAYRAGKIDRDGAAKALTSGGFAAAPAPAPPIAH